MQPLIDALIAACPGFSFEEGVWAFSYCVGVIYSMQLMDRRYDALLGGAKVPSAEHVLADIVAFCSAGVRAIATRRRQLSGK